jgi:hypothetical protein
LDSFLALNPEDVQKIYPKYVEFLKNIYNAVDGTFYDAIKIGKKEESVKDFKEKVAVVTGSASGIGQE